MNQNKNIVLWARGSIREGMGHLIRCLSISRDLIELKLSPILIIECDPDVKKKIDLNNFFHPRLKVFFHELNKNTEDLIVGGDLCIIDRYIYDEKIFKVLKKRFNQIIVFDELEKITFESILRKDDLIVRAQLLNNRRKLEKNVICKILYGLDFFVINKKNKYKYSTKKNIDLLVMLGGGFGYSFFYEKMAEIVSRLIRLDPSLKVTFVLGYCSDNNLNNKLLSICNNLKIYHFVEDPIELMFQSKVGVFSGGYSKYEASFARLPSLIIPVQPHQYDIGRKFCDFGGGIFAGDIKINYEYIFNSLNKLLYDKQFSQTIRRSTSGLIDGLAIQRLIKYFI